MNTEIQEVELQLASWCNRSCNFCPSGKFEVQRTFMSREVFETVVLRLQEIHFNGKVGFHLMSEPLLDKRLPEFLATIRKALPEAFLYLDTNGDALKRETAMRLFGGGLNRMLINCYDSPAQVEKRMEDCRSLCRENPEIWFWNKYLGYPLSRPHTWKVISLRDFSGAAGLRLKNWAGHTRLWRTQPVEFPVRMSCGRPFGKLHITYRADVVLCNMDWKHEVIVGNLERETIPEIWYGSPILAEYREKLSGQNRDMHLCRTCDNGLPYDLPPYPQADGLAAYRAKGLRLAARLYSRFHPGVLQSGK